MAERTLEKIHIPIFRKKGAVFSAVQEARADDNIRTALPERIQKDPDLCSKVLAIAIELDRYIVALRPRVLETRLHGTTNAQIERHVCDAHAGLPGDIGGSVAGSVIHNQDIRLRNMTAEVLDNSVQTLLFVVCWDNYQYFIHAEDENKSL